MSNACFQSHNPPGHECATAPRGKFQIPTGGPFVDVGEFRRVYKVTYLKYAARLAYAVVDDGRADIQERPLWSCTCPDFEFKDRGEQRTVCKHIQSCIDKEMGLTRNGSGDYEQFLVEHVN